MRQLLVVGDQVCDVDLAEVLLSEHVLPNLVSASLLETLKRIATGLLPVDEGIVDVELQDELDKLVVNFSTVVVSFLFMIAT